MNQSLKQALFFWLIPILLISFWYFKEIILIFGTGITLGLAIQYFGHYLQHKLKTPFYLNILIIYLILIFLISLVFSLIFKVVITELPNLIEKIKIYFPLVEKEFEKIDWKNLVNLAQLPLGSFFNFAKFFSSLSIKVFEIIFIFVISLYTALNRNFIYNIINPLFFLSDENKERLSRFLKIAQIRVSFWFLGQLFLMFFIGLATYLFMGPILKIQYSALIGLVAGFFEIIPTFGPIFTLILAVITTFVDKPEFIFWVIAYFLSLQLFENYFLVPLVMKKAVNVHPLLILLGFLVGAKIGGVLGIILILPLLGVLVELFKFLSKDSK